MLVLLHVSVAILSILQATYMCIVPSQRKLQVANGLIAATLASGTYLVWSLHSPLLQSCTTGLMYLAFVLSVTALGRYRLAKVRAKV